MTGTVHAAAGRLVQEAEALAAVVESAGDDELVALLPAAEAVARRLDRLVVEAVATLQRRGVFSERGYRSTVGALADLVGRHGRTPRREAGAIGWPLGSGEESLVRTTTSSVPSRLRVEISPALPGRGPARRLR